MDIDRLVVNDDAPRPYGRDDFCWDENLTGTQHEKFHEADMQRRQANRSLAACHSMRLPVQLDI